MSQERPSRRYMPPGMTLFSIRPARGPLPGSLKTARFPPSGAKGKHLWMELDQPPHPYFHFGMSGAFYVYASVKDRPKYLKTELLMADGTRLGYRNIRRIGRVRLLDRPEEEPPVSELGFDPYLDLRPSRHLKPTWCTGTPRSRAFCWTNALPPEWATGWRTRSSTRPASSPPARPAAWARMKCAVYAPK